MKLTTPEQMRQMDQRTIAEVGIPGIVLMERAALGAVAALVEEMPDVDQGRVGLLCGGGNNGGDGLAMARMLSERGVEALVVLLSEADSMRGDAATNLEIARSHDLELVELGEAPPEEVAHTLDALGPCAAWCDALLGTGLDREVAGRYAAAIAFLNRQRFVLAVDIPSGVDAATGQVLGCGVEADVTATFGALKLGHALYPGRSLCGDLHLVDIGIPEAVVDEVGWAGELLERRWARSKMQPRPAVYHKGDSGKLLILAGSHQKTGAALLASRGALCSGVGLLTVGTHAEAVSRIAPAIHEAMAAELLSEAADPNCEERLREFLPQVDAVAAGPGMGTSDGPRQALEAVLQSDVEAAVFDADALTILAGAPDYAELRAFAQSATVVLTPHPGEMARLCGCAIDDILADPVERATALAERTGAIVVLKMAATLVASPDGELAVNATGNPGMATGGVGDVLTGVIAARLAEASEAAFDAVCLSVYAHGQAGDDAAELLGERGMGAVDLAEQLPLVWKRLES
jgi:ADP-dependent NAD(P)H-hydrate dehydratase / NAD(P)H-hydrate epimerase